MWQDYLPRLLSWCDWTRATVLHLVTLWGGEQGGRGVESSHPLGWLGSRKIHNPGLAM